MLKKQFTINTLMRFFMLETWKSFCTPECKMIKWASDVEALQNKTSSSESWGAGSFKLLNDLNLCIAGLLNVLWVVMQLISQEVWKMGIWMDLNTPQDYKHGCFGVIQVNQKSGSLFFSSFKFVCLQILLKLLLLTIQSIRHYHIFLHYSWHGNSFLIEAIMKLKEICFE